MSRSVTLAAANILVSRVFEILGRIIGEDQMNTVRAGLTATPEPQRDFESAD